MQFVCNKSKLDLEIGDCHEALNAIAAEANESSVVSLRYLHAIRSWLVGQGLEAATTTTAWAFWRAVTWRVEQLQQQYQQEADIAFWFKVDPWELSSEQKTGLLANLVRVQSQQILQSGNYDRTNYEKVYQLTLDATGDERLARRARTRALEAYVDAQVAKGGGKR